MLPASLSRLALGLLLASGAVSAQATPGNGPRPIGPPAPLPTGELHWGDFDGDGLPDALAVTAQGNQLLYNRGSGLFDDVTEISGLGDLPPVGWALWGDLDGDHWQDLVVGVADGVVLLHNEGFAFSIWDSPAFTSLTGVTGAHWVDLDLDAVPDLHLETSAGELVFRNRGGGTFDPVNLHAVEGGAPGTDPAGGQDLAGGGQTSVPAGDAGSDDGLAGGSSPRSAPGVVPPSGLPPAPSGSLTTAPPGTLGARDRTSGSGNVRTGSQLAPIVGCANTLKDVATGMCLEASSVPALGKLYPLSEDLYVDPTTGHVGIGTTTVGPQALTVEGRALFQLATQAAIEVTLPGAQTGLIMTSVNGVKRYMQIEDDQLVLGGAPLDERFYFGDGGHLGIGEQNPTFELDIQRTGDAVIHLVADTDNSGEDDNATIYFRQDGFASQALVGFEAVPGVAGTDNLFRIMTESAATPLVFGTNNVEHVRITDGGLVSVKQTLEIRGGADIVEGFDSSCGELEPGTVVVIDPQVAGALSCSWEAYDTKVAGVVSGAGGVRPGLALGQDGLLDGDTPVAMTGRVYVKCSAENGAIVPGDRLTTAGLPGHAMKATDGSRADGSVLGKAMSALDEGTGLVLVLVNLQ